MREVAVDPLTTSRRASSSPRRRCTSADLVAHRRAAARAPGSGPARRHSRRFILPLLREGECIGALALTRDRSGPFTDAEIALARIVRGPGRHRNRERPTLQRDTEALERQTATADILRVISESPTDVQPVLEAVATRAGALCRAEGSRVWLVKDGALHSMTSYGPAYAEGFDDVLPISRESIGGRTVLERRTIQVDDVVQVMHEEYPGIVALQERYGFRTVVNVPLMREGEAVGVISLAPQRGAAVHRFASSRCCRRLRTRP